MRNARLLTAAAVGLVLASAAPAAAIEFNDIGLTRPAGVAGLMFDDRLCFPEPWLEFAGVNMLGLATPASLWLRPLTVLGQVVEAGEDPPAPVVARQMRDLMTDTPTELDRARVEYGVVQTDGYLAFLDCMAALDPAVYQRYRDEAAGVVTDYAVAARRFTDAVGDRAAELATELGAGGAEAAEAIAPLLADPEMRAEDQTSKLLLLVRAAGQIGPDAAPSAAALVGLFGDPRGPVRAAVRQSIARIGAAAAPDVIAALSAADANVRLDAALVLAMTTPPSPDAIAALQAAANDADANVREAVERALARLQAP